MGRQRGLVLRTGGAPGLLFLRAIFSFGRGGFQVVADRAQRLDVWYVLELRLEQRGVRDRVFLLHNKLLIIPRRNIQIVIDLKHELVLEQLASSFILYEPETSHDRGRHFLVSQRGERTLLRQV